MKTLVQDFRLDLRPKVREDTEVLERKWWGQTSTNGLTEDSRVEH